AGRGVLPGASGRVRPSAKWITRPGRGRRRAPAASRLGRRSGNARQPGARLPAKRRDASGGNATALRGRNAAALGEETRDARRAGNVTTAGRKRHDHWAETSRSLERKRMAPGRKLAAAMRGNA